jgi:hypothetical protein
MSDKITFTGAILKSFGRNKNGGKAIFHCNYTKAIGDQMGWGGLTNGQKDVTLEGSLAASTCVFQPNHGELSKWSVEFTASAVKGFEAVRLESEGTKGKSHRFELRFTVEFVDMTACRYLEEFMTHAGGEKSTLTVSYTKAAEQTGMLDDIPALDEERRQATLAEND